MRSSTARILRFPDRRSTTLTLSPEEARLEAEKYLLTPVEERECASVQATLSSPDVLCAILRSLRERGEGSSPSAAFDESERLYRWLLSVQSVGLFDERDFFLGETAFIAGNASRLLGRREDALRWLDRSEAGFRHTVNNAPGLSNVAYARLAVRFEMGMYTDVIDLVPSLTESFRKLGMETEAAKCQLVLSMSLKNSGRVAEAFATVKQLLSRTSLESNPALRSRILSECGDLHRLEGRSESALVAYQEALSLLGGGGVSMARADLRMFVAGMMRAQGDNESALAAFRSAADDYRELSMTTRLAYLNVLTGETLLALGRPREAEWEILQALPTIEEQKMVPEGFAAVALLRESVKRRKADPNALRELREHLQKQN